MFGFVLSVRFWSNFISSTWSPICPNNLCAHFLFWCLELSLNNGQSFNISGVSLGKMV